MKNKIKKILLLGMTAMFTAGAAGTAVISCPVWADEAEQNSETAEEPKAEDAAVEEKIADQTDDKTENTDLKTVEHPRMSAYSIRRFSIVKLIASGGVSGTADLQQLAEVGVEAVVVGKALYEKKIDLKSLKNF